MISIIIPTLNEESVLRETLCALTTLTLPHEVIISDGNSTDQTEVIADKYADKVIRYQGKTRQTIANARNIGAAAAQGEVLLFLDADVQLQKPQEVLTEILNRFAQEPTLVAVTISLRVFPEQEWWQDRLFFGFSNLLHRIRNNFLGVGAAAGEFQCIRRSTFEAVAGYDERLVACEDVDLFKRLSRIGKTSFLTEYTAFHTGRRVHKVGHLKLLLIWALNAFWGKWFHRSFNKEWRPIR